MELTDISDLEDQIDQIASERDSLRHRLREQEQTALAICEKSDADRESGRCVYSRPGRGDCPHFLGFSRKVDEHGKPSGWCWPCWRQYQIEQLSHQIAYAHVILGEIAEYAEATNAQYPSDVLRRVSGRARVALRGSGSTNLTSVAGDEPEEGGR